METLEKSHRQSEFSLGECASSDNFNALSRPSSLHVICLYIIQLHSAAIFFLFGSHTDCPRQTTHISPRLHRMSVEEIQRELLAASTPENQLLADNTEAALRELLETPHGEMLGGYVHSDPSTEFLRRQESFANVREMGGGRPQVWNPHT